jgi:phenylalanyl-tRNA synthetase beta chain
MKIPLNWLGELIKLPEDSKSLTDSLTMVGHMLDKKSITDGKTVIDLELRGNRADCYSILGIAREVSAIFDEKINNLCSLELNNVTKLKNSNLIIKTSLVKRAATTEIYNVKITKSPEWLSRRLVEYGMESINNIVDLTNYVMIETGEPMHAFDLDKITESLEIRLAKDGEKMTTFQNDIITLTKNDLVWAMGNEVLSVAGAIGEKYHSISDTTRNILLEAANYDRANIRRSVYRHNLLTEAGIRHEKELDPNMVESAIGRFLYLIKKYGWGVPNCKVYDYYPKKSKPWKLKLNYKYLKSLGNVDIKAIDVKKILVNLGFKITTDTREDLEVLVPTYRTDITLEEDLVEEVLRIHGYDKIPAHVLSLEIPKDVTPNYIKQEDKLKQNASAVGFSEAISLSFVKEDLAKYNKHSQKGDTKIVSLQNPPSPDYKNLRINLLANLYELARKAIFERASEVRLFEVGKIYSKEKGRYFENRKIGFIYYQEGAMSFEIFKGLINAFFVKMGIDLPSFSSEMLLVPLRDSYELHLNNKIIGYGGQLENIYFAEIDLDSILASEKTHEVTLWPKYPPQIEDITLTFPKKTRIGEVIDSIRSVNQLVNKTELKDSYKDAYTFRIEYQDPEKTLTNEDVEKIRNEILKKVKEKFGGRIENS